MPHSTTLITTIAVGFGLALIFGYIAARLRMPPLVGYLFAGILIGPFTPGFVADVDAVGAVHALTETASGLYVGGVFSSLAGQPRNGTGRISGGVVDAWHPDVGSGDVQINDIVVDPMSQIGVVGSYGGRPRKARSAPKYKGLFYGWYN